MAWLSMLPRGTISQTEVSTIDNEGHKIVLHDVTEVKFARLGKKHDMQWNFNIFLIFGMCFCVVATMHPTLLIKRIFTQWEAP